MKWILILAALQPLPPLDQEPAQPVEYPTNSDCRAAAKAIQTTGVRAACVPVKEYK